MQSRTDIYRREVNSLSLSVHAMATRFELYLWGADPVRLRAAGEEALEEVRRLDSQLNSHSADSEISHINRNAGSRAVRVEPRLFKLLQKCAGLAEATAGSFDITVGPLMRVWRLVESRGTPPSADELERVRSVVGIDQIEFDETECTIRFRRDGVEIDLGAYGKGYAIERAIEILSENAIESGILHGGTSSVYAIGVSPDDSEWRIRLSDPLADNGRPVVVGLSNSALSVSAVHGKWFDRLAKRYGHVIDPRTGQPCDGVCSAAITGPSPTLCEAFSTALLVMGRGWLPTLADGFPGYRGWVN